MLTTSPRPTPRLTTAMTQTIALLALPQSDLVWRLAAAAANNPALRLRPPTGAGWLPATLDPDGISAPGDSLMAHVLGQIAGLNLSGVEQVIALALAEALEPTGWLGIPVTRIARGCGTTEAAVLAMLARLQRIAPGGLFARSLAECLHLQAEQAGELSPAMQAVLADLPGFATGGALHVAAGSGLPLSALQEAAGRIRGYDPKPGLAFAGPLPPAPPADLLLRPTAAAGWEAVTNPHLLSAEAQSGLPGSAAAAALCRALAGRQRVALRLGAILARRQSDWLSGGSPSAVTARELAEESGFHIATVNRCLSAVTARMPAGTRSLRALIADPVGPRRPAAAKIRLRLAELLQAAGSEGSSDARLAAQLTAEGMGIARRTVAKYRATLTR